MTLENSPANASAPAASPKTDTARRRPSVFTIVTMIAAVIAMSMLVWRIGRAWRIEYGGGPRESRPIPTTGSFGPPGGLLGPRSTPAQDTPSGSTSAPAAAPPGTSEAP